jgi:hypothetical protein
VLAVLVRNRRGRVTSQEQGNQRNSAHHIRSWSHIQAWSWEGLIQLGHPSTLHWPADGQFQLLKGAEEDQVVTEVIRAASVGCILWGSPTRWTQVAGEEKLRASIPTVFQRNIVIVSINQVRIRRDNKDGVLHTTKVAVQINQVHTYMNIVYTMCKHVMYMYVTCMYMFVLCMYFTFGFIP